LRRARSAPSDSRRRRTRSSNGTSVHRDLDDLPESTSFGPYLDQMHSPIGLASRLVVHPGHWRRGFAERIIADRLDLAASHGLTEVWGETRRHQIHGLTRHGYEPLGPSADDSVPGEWVVLRAPLGTAPPTGRT
jgi:GNAT superfamily N-acetyltransferase